LGGLTSWALSKPQSQCFRLYAAEFSHSVGKQTFAGLGATYSAQSRPTSSENRNRCTAAPDFVCLAWRCPQFGALEFAGKPTCCFSGFHRIDKLDSALVNVITSGTLERSNVKAGGARGNAGQHGCCLARGARWPRDNHAASPLISGEHNTLSTGRCHDGPVMEPPWHHACPSAVPFCSLSRSNGEAPGLGPRLFFGPLRAGLLLVC
jgi:hypothetical protein